MKVCGYDALTDFSCMYQAYKWAARGKRCKAEVVEFELDLARNLWELIDQQAQGTYRVGGY